MRTATKWLMALVVLALPEMAALGDEEKVPLDKVPAKVLAAVKDKFAGAEPTGAVKITENGKFTFEVSFKYKDLKYEATLKEDGTMLEWEKEVAAKDLPEAVTKALEAKYPKATYESMVVVTKIEDKKERLSHYEVVVLTADKKKKEVEISPDGKFLDQ
jgi:hypothetical protein